MECPESCPTICYTKNSSKLKTPQSRLADFLPAATGNSQATKGGARRIHIGWGYAAPPDLCQNKRLCLLSRRDAKHPPQVGVERSALTLCSRFVIQLVWLLASGSEGEHPSPALGSPNKNSRN
jgi:hypothetical protein